MHRAVLECNAGFSGQFSPKTPGKKNLLHLKSISQSFDDLTSETLYSKWKKARKNGAKMDRLHRTTSLISLPEEDLVVNRDDGSVFTNTLASELRRQIFRPRGWTVCSGESLKEKDGGFFSDTASTSSTEPDGLTISSFNSSDNLDDDVFASNSFKLDKEDTIEVQKSKIISEIISGTSGDFAKKIRSLSDSDQRTPERPPIRARTASDPDSTSREDSGNHQKILSYREPREVEFLKTAEMAQRYLDAQQEDVWKKRGSSAAGFESNRHKRMSRNPVLQSMPEGNFSLVNIQDTASLGFPNDMSQADAEERYVLGSTYALIRQPQPQSTYLKSSSNNTLLIGKGIRNSTQNPGILLRTMSEPSQGSVKKELASSEEKEKDEKSVVFKEVDVVGSLPKGKTRGDGSRTHVRRAQTLPRMPKRPLTNFNMKNWKENEQRTLKAANDLLENINNSSEKTQQERVDVVEKAFEWIRKEVADLRAQDKDIMRMFTKIQAGIRHIKFDQTSLMESDEDFISTPDLSRTRTSSLTSKDDSSVPRRASLL